MRLQCMMRVQFGDVIHEVGEVVERDYEEVKQAIRDRALIPLPDLPSDPSQNAHDSAVKQPVTTVNVAEAIDAVFKPSASSSNTSEVKED